MDMKRRILSCFLAFCMIFALLPAPAQAAGNAENATPTVTATVQHAATGQITAQIEAYMTDSANKTRTVKPCDIIFLIEQSQFMNTQNGSASSGDERAEILSAIDRLLDGMPQPTTGGAHRIAIAGYGRINNPGRSDIYDATLYPGTPSDNNDSLNTGYYTKDDTKGVFHSQSGWTEWNKIDGHTDATLPQLPSGYLTDGYDDVFLSVDDAKQVIDADKMVPWHAGAARMDAGLTITEQLAKIAKAEADSKDRNLIVCIAASSLPYQNSGTYQKLRPDAAIEAANTLKETYGATIFGLGDFNKLNLESGNPLNDPDEQRKNFNDTMASICGNSSTSGADYFKGLSQVHDIDEALNELMTKIDANVGEGAAEKLSIDVDHFTEGEGGYSWSQLKDGHHILSAGSIREVASVDYYRFTGYDDNGKPLFEPTPSRHTEQNLADIGRGNAIQTSLNILPIPPQEKAGETIRGANYGEKVVITITDPVCIDYDWIGRWRPDFAAPEHEHAARGTTHKPAAPTQNAVAGKDLNLKFDGWYRLWDETIDKDKPTWEYGGKTYVKYAGTVFPAFGSDLKLYGRWLPEIQVSFHWAGSVIPVDGDGNEIAAPSALSLSLDGEGNRYYKATAPTADGFEFDGWYKDSACTQKFEEGGEDLTANTNLYGRWTRLGTKIVTFKVQNGTWSGGATEDKTVPVELRNGLGTLSADAVPTGMIPDTEHKTPGAWDSHPNTNTDGISETENYVYTYTFPPKSKCTVTYHWASTENPNSAVLPTQATVIEGTPYKVETVDSVDGWTFSGWYNSEGTSVTEVKYSSAGQNIDLYGKWTHDACTVTFYADYKGAERGYLNADPQTVSTYTVPYGSTLQNAGKSLPTPVPGKDCENQWFFKDWDRIKDWDLGELSSYGIFYTDLEVLNMPVRSNLTFVAQWWPIVTFDANGGAWSSGETMHYVKITDKVAAESTPVRNGYTFLGWYTDDGNRANFEDTVNGPTTLYAHWAKNAAVTFRIVNGTWSGGAAEDKTVSVVLYPQADGTASGTLDASYVPQIMLPAPGYENIAGGWEQTPNTDPNGITGDVTYVYRFGSTGGGSSSGHSTRYTLHYESNGGTAYKDERCSSGTKVTLDKTPTRESYTFTGWYADKALTQKITSVTMNSDKTVYAGWEATGVPDKLNGDDHFAYVVGYSDSTVRPSANISRAEVATIFFRLLKSDIRDGNLTADNEFSDVSDGQWHNKAISTMAKLGIVKGRRADSFAPDASITRAEFAAICARFNTKPVENSSSFSDISGHWAENEIERAAAFGWISGYPDGTFRPDARITRAEAMTMINRVLCRMPQSESDLLDSMVTWPDNKPSDWHYLAVQEATNSHDFNRQGEVGESWTKLTSVPDWTRYQ